MTTTELIKILQDNEKGAISHKSREISLTINGRYMINPQINVSGTGDGICGAEIDLDINGEWLEQEHCDNAISRTDMLDAIGHGTIYTSDELQKIIKALPPVNPQNYVLPNYMYNNLESTRRSEDGTLVLSTDDWEDDHK